MFFVDAFITWLHELGIRVPSWLYSNAYGQDIEADRKDIRASLSWGLLVNAFLAVAVIGFAWRPLIVPAARNLNNLLNPAPPAVINSPVVIVLSQTLTATETLISTPTPTLTLTSTVTLIPTATLTPTFTLTPTASTAECKVLESPLQRGSEEKHRVMDEFFEAYPNLWGTEDSPSFIWTTYPSVEGGVWMVIEVNKFYAGEVVPQDGDAIRAGATKFCVKERGGFILLPSSP
jgi:hypothetical protein